ncbi:unnamed protein product [Linum trigynum]|uniref:Plant thionin family protein n=1 Tax=Linum trigynum TaxID=586398 RepID=A0AAV2GFX9_9ROSI
MEGRVSKSIVMAATLVVVVIMALLVAQGDADQEKFDKCYKACMATCHMIGIDMCMTFCARKCIEGKKFSGPSTSEKQVQNITTNPVEGPHQ